MTDSDIEALAAAIAKELWHYLALYGHRRITGQTISESEVQQIIAKAIRYHMRAMRDP